MASTSAVPSADPTVVDSVFKAYDIRGTVPDEINEPLAACLGNAFVQVAHAPASHPGDRDPHGTPGVVVGHDMRTTSPALAEAFAEGAAQAGADVTMIGLASTDQLYYASGALGLPGAMFTASHNPARYNGVKLCRAGAAPLGVETGLDAVRALVVRMLTTGPPTGPPAERRRDGELTAPRRGSVRRRDVLDDYAEHLRRLAPVGGRRLTVVVDAGSGMAGLTAPATLGALDLELVPLYFDLDGTFPHHEANPLDPANLEDLQREVVARGADLGLAFDGDADRCFVVDERGAAVSPSVLTALIAERELTAEPGGTVIHNLITSRVVPEVVRACGGTPVRTRVGHSFIKATMAQTDAVFGGEHSGHFYFRDFWRADSGMLAALHLLAALAEQDQPLSTVLAPYHRYVASGELNSQVSDVATATARVQDRFAQVPGAVVDHLDGLTVEHDDWWFNLRPSNTEPLLRLNVEAREQTTMCQVRDEVLQTLRTYTGPDDRSGS